MGIERVKAPANKLHNSNEKNRKREEISSKIKGKLDCLAPDEISLIARKNTAPSSPKSSPNPVHDPRISVPVDLQTSLQRHKTPKSAFDPLSTPDLKNRVGHYSRQLQGGWSFFPSFMSLHSSSVTSQMGSENMPCDLKTVLLGSFCHASKMPGRKVAVSVPLRPCSM
jgi:hypothetical protein